jgi:hypothetical protein
MASIVEDWARGRHWIIQPAFRSKERIATLARDGEAVESDAYPKWSGFYGPDGLMAISVYHRNFHKVHGSEDTVMSIVY